MRRWLLPISLCIAWFALFFWHSDLSPHDAQKDHRSKPDSIEGKWTVIFEANGEGFQSKLPEAPRQAILGEMAFEPFFFVWKITANTIEIGLEDATGKLKGRFGLRARYNYKLDPENQKGAIDTFPFDEDKDNKKKGKFNKVQGIYFVKGDFMIICSGRDSRPKDFTTTKENDNWITVLYRSKLSSAGLDAPKAKRK